MARGYMPFAIGTAVGAVLAAIAYYATSDFSTPDHAEIGRRSAESDRVRQSIATSVQRERLTEPTGELASSITALQQIRNPAELRQASLALVDSLGANLATIESIANALPPLDRLNFVCDAIAQVAEDRPEFAIELAVSLDDLPSQQAALTRIGRTLAAVDPAGSLRLGDWLANFDMGDLLRGAIFDSWALSNPEGLLEFLQDARLDSFPPGSRAIEFIAENDPLGVLDRLDAMPESIRNVLQGTALETLALEDPLYAYRRANTLAPGQLRDRVLSIAGETLAQRDPDAAIAWIASLDPPVPPAATGVLTALSKSDPLRAADFMIEQLLISKGPRSNLNSFQLPGLTNGSRDQLGLIAEKFLAHTESQLVKEQFGAFLSDWGRSDGSAVVDWTMLNLSRLDADTVWYAAGGVGRSDIDLAMQAADRLPPAMRASWVQQVAQTSGGRQFDDVIDWLSRYSDEEFYDDALRRALNTQIQSGISTPGNVDAAAIGSFLTSQVPERTTEFMGSLMRVWSQTDPAAASDWLNAVTPEDANETLVRNSLRELGSTWAARDPRAARQWALDLDPGEDRDAALESYLTIVAGTGVVEPEVLSAFSSDTTRQQALARSMANLGRFDADLGRQLIQSRITDPVIRMQAEEALIAGMTSSAINFGNTMMVYR